VSLLTPEDIRTRLLARWRKGEFLRMELELEPEPEPDAVAGEAPGAPAGSRPNRVPPTPSFPFRVPVKPPSAREMSENFPAVQDWARRYLETGSGPTVEWREHRHRQLGTNRVPAAICFDSIDNLARFLKGGASAELARFREAVAILQERLPEILPHARSRPFELLEHSDLDLGRLIDTVLWVRENPRPGIYLRQLPVPLVDTKFVEHHRAVLSRWLDLALPPESVDYAWSGAAQFDRRYGFTPRPELMRVRILDDTLRPAGFSDITVPAAEFCHWSPKLVQRVFVLENDVTALSLPSVPGAVAVFGRGYHFGQLRNANWLERAEIYYWGDIDTHGFAILDQFRRVFPHTRSLLMDRHTLDAHELQWGVESAPTRVDLPYLNADETVLYNDLRFDRIRPRLRLEQELINFPVIELALTQLLG